MAFLGEQQSVIYTFCNIILGIFAIRNFPWPRDSRVYNALVKIMVQVGKVLLRISEPSEPDGDS